MRYAKTTSVTVEKSQIQIQQVLKKYGADQFMYAWADETVMIGFRIDGYPVQIQIPMPEKPQEQRQAMRVLLLLIKAKLEWIETGLSTVAAEFMAQLMLPNGQSMAQWALPHLESGKMPRSLPALPEPKEKVDE